MLLMALGAMLVNRRGFIRLMAVDVRRDALAAVEDLDGRCGGANLHDLAGERVRNAVEVEVELDVVVNVNARLRPVMKLEGFGGQRPESGSVQLLKQAGPAAGALAEGPVVEFLQ